jgi:hypothetical protein
MSLSKAVDGNYFNTSMSGNIHFLSNHVRLVSVEVVALGSIALCCQCAGRLAIRQLAVNTW